MNFRTTITAGTLTAALVAGFASAAGAVTFDQSSQISGTLQNDLQLEDGKRR